MTIKTIAPSTWELPEAVSARLGDSVGRQRAMVADNHLLLVLHAPPDSENDIHRQGRLFWRQPNNTWKSSHNGAGVAAVRDHLEQFAKLVESFEDQLQTATAAQEYFRALQEIAPLHRTARNLHATLQQARETFPADRDLITLRDRAGDIERAAELLHGDAKNGLDFTIARQAERQAQASYSMAVSAHRLNFMAAIFLPLATLSSVLGMNLPHGLERFPAPITFWLVLVTGVFAGIMLSLFTSIRIKQPDQIVALQSKKRKRR